jgi:hypothetical protein
MEVSFQCAREDYAVLRSSSWFTRLMNVTRMVCGMLLSCIPGVLIVLSLGWTVSLMPIAGLVAVGIVRLVWQVLNAERPVIPDDSPLLKPQCVRLRNDAVEFEDEHGWARRGWLRIDGARTVGRHVLLLLEAGAVIVIPRSAFESSNEADEFVDRVEAEQQKAAFSSKRLRNQSADCVAVKYTNAPTDFAVAQPPVESKTSSSIGFLFPIWICTFALLSGRAWAACLIGTVIFLFVTVPTFVLLIRYVPLLFNSVRPREFLQMEVRVDSGGVSCLQQNFESGRRWDGFIGWRALDDFIAIHSVADQVRFLIPRSAFSNAATERAFEKVIASNLPMLPEDRELGSQISEFKESGNPYQPPGDPGSYKE